MLLPVVPSFGVSSLISILNVLIPFGLFLNNSLFNSNVNFVFLIIVSCFISSEELNGFLIAGLILVNVSSFTKAFLKERAVTYRLP